MRPNDGATGQGCGRSRSWTTEGKGRGAEMRSRGAEKHAEKDRMTDFGRVDEREDAAVDVRRAAATAVAAPREEREHAAFERAVHQRRHRRARRREVVGHVGQRVEHRSRHEFLRASESTTRARPTTVRQRANTKRTVMARDGRQRGTTRMKRRIVANERNASDLRRGQQHANCGRQRAVEPVGQREVSQAVDVICVVVVLFVVLVRKVLAGQEPSVAADGHVEPLLPLRAVDVVPKPAHRTHRTAVRLGRGLGRLAAPHRRGGVFIVVVVVAADAVRRLLGNVGLPKERLGGVARGSERVALVRRAQIDEQRPSRRPPPSRLTFKQERRDPRRRRRRRRRSGRRRGGRGEDKHGRACRRRRWQRGR